MTRSVARSTIFPLAPLAAVLLVGGVATPAASATDVSPAKVIGTQTTTLVAPDPGTGYLGFGESFGGAVAVSGSTMAISGPLHTVGANNYQGIVYVYVKKSSIWTLQAEIQDPDPAPYADFGSSLTLSGSTLVVGAEDHGAYVFTRKGTTWTEQATLTPSDGAPGDDFGVSLALSGTTIVVGSLYAGASDHGAAYVFTRKGTAWTQQAELSASDGATDDTFGRSVAIVGSTVAVGAPLHHDLPGSGSVYVFKRKGTVWSQQAEVADPGTESFDEFGSSLAMSGSTLVIGAYGTTVNGHSAQGTTYVFTRAGTAWTQQAELDATDGQEQDGAGRAVSLSGTTVVVGAPFGTINGNEAQGRVFVFVKKGKTWTQTATLLMNNAGAGENFGEAVKVSGSSVVAGAPGRLFNGLIGEGAVGIFK